MGAGLIIYGVGPCAYGPPRVPPTDAGMSAIVLLLLLSSVLLHSRTELLLSFADLSIQYKIAMICRLRTRFNLTVSETFSKQKRPLNLVCWHQLLSAVRLSFGFQLGSTGFAECTLT